MRALRRAWTQLKCRGYIAGSSRVCYVKPETASHLEHYSAGVIEAHGEVLDALVRARRFYCTSSLGIRTFCSQSGAKSSVGQQDDASEDAFSGDEMDDESELFEGLGNETDVKEKKSPRTDDTSPMIRVILDTPASLVGVVLSKWVEADNEVTQGEALSGVVFLRKLRFFSKALQLLEWSVSTNHLELDEISYAIHVDLIAKVHGIFMAEGYLQQIPESFKSGRVYHALLANCVATMNARKAEAVFEQMKKLFPVSCFSYNQLLLLYTKTDKKKISGVLWMMEKENIEPSIYTYQLLLSAKQQSHDMNGVEQIVELMKSKGVEPSVRFQASLARFYSAHGLKDKAEFVLKEIEDKHITERPWVSQYLLPAYASLGRDDEVGRIWKLCERDPGIQDCMAAIEAWGQLKRIEDAEAVFEKMLEVTKWPSARNYVVLLNVYANHKMLSKGRDLVRRMEESGITVLQMIWDALIRLYTGAGEVEKADYILEKAITDGIGKTPPTSYLTLLDAYAKSGDVHNAEKIFVKMRRAGYTSQIRPYRALLTAYINAGVPAYGFEERMRADKVVPDRALAVQLVRVSALEKSEVGELQA